MEIFINGQKADITLDTEKHLGEVLGALEEEFARNDATTVTISVNGNSVTAAEFDDITKLPVETIQTLELSTVAQGDIVSAFKEVGDEFDHISQELKQLAVLFQSGHDGEAARTVKKLADTVDSFCRVTTLSALFPQKFENITIQGMSVSSFFEELTPILTEFEEALQNSDSVLIGDLAEYEISPRIDSIVEMTRNLA